MYVLAAANLQLRPFIQVHRLNHAPRSIRAAQQKSCLHGVRNRFLPRLSYLEMSIRGLGLPSHVRVRHSTAQPSCLQSVLLTVDFNKRPPKANPSQTFRSVWTTVALAPVHHRRIHLYNTTLQPPTSTTLIHWPTCNPPNVTAIMDAPEPETPFAAVSAQTTKFQRVSRFLKESC